MPEYNTFDKVIHRQFLGDNNFSDFLYESIFANTKKYKINNKKCHIFITGLARAGTTNLLNNLYSSKNFGSFTYKYMPFILSPVIAKTFSYFNRKSVLKLKERLHKDGIYIDINSPECLEEVFWIKSNIDFSGKVISLKDDINSDILNAYSYLINRFSEIEGKENMIIKNNNNHTRLGALSKYFENSKFLIMFRDPLAHASSLFNQHRNFLAIQKKDPFVLEYMNLIGHKEFGKNATPFIYETDLITLKKKENNKTIDYWLLQWINTYNWILRSNLLDRKNIFLISYESLCDEPKVFSKICKLIGIDHKKNIGSFQSKNPKYSSIKDSSFEKSILNKANQLYYELIKRSFN